jgi:hypothetical protein
MLRDRCVSFAEVSAFKDEGAVQGHVSVHMLQGAIYDTSKGWADPRGKVTGTSISGGA